MSVFDHECQCIYIQCKESSARSHHMVHRVVESELESFGAGMESVVSGKLSPKMRPKMRVQVAECEAPQEQWALSQHKRRPMVGIAGW